MPPYTTRSSGRSATSGSRLFWSIRNAASCGHPRPSARRPWGADGTGAGGHRLTVPHPGGASHAVPAVAAHGHRWCRCRLVALNGSHSAASSTHALAALAVELHGSGQVVDLVTLDPAGLIGTARATTCRRVLAAIEAASILVLVTPIYRATYSGLLKVLFDQLPAGALAGKVAVLAATAGGPPTTWRSTPGGGRWSPASTAGRCRR